MVRRVCRRPAKVPEYLALQQAMRINTLAWQSGIQLSYEALLEAGRCHWRGSPTRLINILLVDILGERFIRLNSCDVDRRIFYACSAIEIILMQTMEIQADIRGALKILQKRLRSKDQLDEAKILQEIFEFQESCKCSISCQTENAPATPTTRRSKRLKQQAMSTPETPQAASSSLPVDEPSSLVTTCLQQPPPSPPSETNSTQAQPSTNDDGSIEPTNTTELFPNLVPVLDLQYLAELDQQAGTMETLDGPGDDQTTAKTLQELFQLLQRYEHFNPLSLENELVDLVPDQLISVPEAVAPSVPISCLHDSGADLKTSTAPTLRRSTRLTPIPAKQKAIPETPPAASSDPQPVTVTPSAMVTADQQLPEDTPGAITALNSTKSSLDLGEKKKTRKQNANSCSQPGELTPRKTRSMRDSFQPATPPKKPAAKSLREGSAKRKLFADSADSEQPRQKKTAASSRGPTCEQSIQSQQGTKDDWICGSSSIGELFPTLLPVLDLHNMDELEFSTSTVTKPDDLDSHPVAPISLEQMLYLLR